MTDDRTLLQNLASIHRHARASEDGQRCMVAAHPDLQARIRQQLAILRASAAGVPAALLQFHEPQRPGFNDGLIYPPSFFPAAGCRRLQVMRERVQGFVDELVETMLPAGKIELMNGFAIPLLFRVIFTLLGIPTEYQEEARRLFNEASDLTMAPTHQLRRAIG